VTNKVWIPKSVRDSLSPKALCRSCGKEFMPQIRWGKTTVRCQECISKNCKTPKIEKQEFTCLWCHTKFKSHMKNTRFCCEQHRNLFYKIQRQIYMKYTFDHEAHDKAIADLTKEGQKILLKGVLDA
jgi:hypothetical protein